MKRNLAIISQNSETVAQCQEAAILAGDAIGEVVVYSSAAELEGVQCEGMVVVDPTALEQGSVHEWSLCFLRNHRALLFILSNGGHQDADGLARFVGAQGAILLPVNPATLADLLDSPFGAPQSVKPAPAPQVDASSLEDRLAEMVSAHADEDRESFLRQITDAGTGLFSADYWEHRLDEEFKRSSRFRFPLGLVAFSLDGEVNDDCILNVASVILLDTRDVDVVARWDHHVFVALLPHTGPAGVRLFGERVLEGLRALEVRDLMGEIVSWEVSTAICPDAALASSQELLDQVLPQTA